MDDKHLTNIVAGEVQNQLKPRFDIINHMKYQMSTVIQDLERNWHSHHEKLNHTKGNVSKELQPTIHSTIHPRHTNNDIATDLPKIPFVKKKKKKKLSCLHPKKKEQIVDPQRNSDGKLNIDKNLPRVANIDIKNGVNVCKEKMDTRDRERAAVYYPNCMNNVYKPSAYDNTPTDDIWRQNMIPSLQIDYINGFSIGTSLELSPNSEVPFHSIPTNYSTASKILYLQSGEIVWYVATVVILYDIKLKSQRHFRAHTDTVTSICVHPNGEIIASGQVGTKLAPIYVWNAIDVPTSESEQLHTLCGNKVAVRCLNFSHDGELLVSLSADIFNTICIHDWKRQKLLTTARAHSFRVHYIAFNPYQAYGKPTSKYSKPGEALHKDEASYTLVSCGVKHIRFWILTRVESENIGSETEGNIRTSNCNFTLQVQQAPSHMASKRTWKLEGNMPSYTGRMEQHDFTCLTFIDDSIKMHVYSKPEFKDVCDLNGAGALVEIDNKEHLLGRIVAGTAKGDIAVFWQPRQGFDADDFGEDLDVIPAKWWELPSSALLESDTSVIEKIEFEPNGHLVEIVPRNRITGNKLKLSKQIQGELDIITKQLSTNPHSKDLREKYEKMQYDGPLSHDAIICQVAYCPNTEIVATSGADGQIKLWKCALLSLMRIPGATINGQYTKPYDSIFQGKHSMTLIGTGPSEFEVPQTTMVADDVVDNAQSAKYPGKPISLSWNADGSRLVVGTSTNCIWELIVASGTWELLIDSSHMQGMVDCAAHPHKGEILVLANDGTLMIWDISAHKCTRRVQTIYSDMVQNNYGNTIPEKQKPTCIDIHPEGTNVVVGLSSCELVSLEYDSLSIQVSHTQKLAGGNSPLRASAPYCGAAWNRPLSIPTSVGNQSGSICQVKFDPHGNLLAVGFKDHSIGIFDVKAGYKKRNTCHGHTSYITHLTWSEDGKVLMSNSSNGEVLHWAINEKNRRDRVIHMTDPFIVRDVPLSNWSCILGWATSGIWGLYPENTTPVDIACVKSKEVNLASGAKAKLLAIAARQTIQLFQFPAFPGCQSKRELAHSSRVIGIAFSHDGKHIVTLGINDGALIQWRLHYDSFDSYSTKRSTFSIAVPPLSEKSPKNVRIPSPRQRNFKKLDPHEASVSLEGKIDVEPDKIQQLFRATQDYIAENDECLSFKVGDIMHNVIEDSGEWWTGTLDDGSTGLFPNNLIEEVTETTTAHNDHDQEALNLEQSNKTPLLVTD